MSGEVNIIETGSKPEIDVPHLAEVRPNPSRDGEFVFVYEVRVQAAKCQPGPVTAGAQAVLDVVDNLPPEVQPALGYCYSVMIGAAAKQNAAAKALRDAEAEVRAELRRLEEAVDAQVEATDLADAVATVYARTTDSWRRHIDQLVLLRTESDRIDALVENNGLRRKLKKAEGELKRLRSSLRTVGEAFGLRGSEGVS